MNNVKPLHYINRELSKQKVMPLPGFWLDVEVIIFAFTNKQLFVYLEVWDSKNAAVKSKKSDYYYYSDITNLTITEINNEINVEFKAGDTYFRQFFPCEDGDGTYDSIMFLQESIKKHHEK